MSDIIPQKICHTCGESKPATKDFFAVGKKSRGGLRNLCKECKNKARRKTTPHLPHSKYVLVPEGCKRCSRCKKDLPATREYFGYRSRTKDHLYEYCHECTKAIGEEQKAAPPLPDKPDIMACSKCGIEKPFTLDFFYKNSRAAYKMSRICQECQNEHGEIYRKEHAEEISKRMKKYHQTYKQYLTETYRKWIVANRAHLREQDRQRRITNPKPYQAKRQRYLQTEHGRQQNRAYRLMRYARKKGVGGKYTSQDVQRQYKAQKGKCYWCSTKFGKGKNAYHVDHIVPITREGSSNDPCNLVLACPTCNMSRSNKLPHEWPEGGRLL